MYSKTTIIKNKDGLHARPASNFVQYASKYESKITIRDVDEDKEVNAKSMMMLLSLGSSQGTKVEINAQGEDEVEAVEALIELINSGFDD